MTTTEDKLAVVQAAFDAYLRGDNPGMLALADPEIVVTQFPEQVDVRPYHGHDGVRQMMADWIDTWDDYSIEVLDLREVGERVVASLRQRGRGKGSGIEMEADTWFVWSVRGGKVVRWQMFSSEREALEAALSPGST
jgi:ketosteroid isomerase-like protein